MGQIPTYTGTHEAASSQKGTWALAKWAKDRSELPKEAPECVTMSV